MTRAQTNAGSGDRVRLDKWLWAARFFKTRALATEAVSGGKVHLNGERVKPARILRVDDSLTINKGEIHFEVRVLALSDRRGPANQARLLYEESEQSITRRAEESEQRRLQARAAPRRERRPEGRVRRMTRDQRHRQS